MKTEFLMPSYPPFYDSKKLKMKKIYFFVCGKNNKIKNPKISQIFEKTILYIICSKCNSKDEKIFKEDEAIKILQILGLINNIEQQQKNATEENISQEFRLKEIDEKKLFY